MMRFNRNVTIIWVLVIVSISIHAERHESELFSILEKKDQTFFDRGFNQCDINYLENNVSDSLVFFHDKSGIQDKKIFMENTKKYICGNPEKKPIRKRVEGSLQVFPLYNNGVLYGAIQTGEHEFFIREYNKVDRLTNIAKFTSVWLLENDHWMLTQVLSYDHQEPSESQMIESLLKDSHVPALALGVITGGNIERLDVYGELKKGVPAPKNSLFKVASLTKPIVALIALKLVARGKLDLDEPLHSYWVDPDVRDDNQHKLLTTRLILTHQTGFANWRWMEKNGKLRFQFRPGEKHQYSGEGFEYLRRALEKKLSLSIEDLASEYVFEQAKMKDTHFWWDESVEQARFAINHDNQGNELSLKKYYQANAAANLITTIEDYTRFMVYLMAQSSEMPTIYSEMIRPQVKLKENDYFGLGWEILSGFSNNEFALLHTGKDPGVNTLAIFYPASRNGYVIFMNGDNSTPVFENLLPSLYLGKALWEKR